MVRTTRRMTLRSAGVVAAVVAGVSVPVVAPSNEWNTAETPTENTLYDVVYAATGAYAVGGGGIVLERTEDGWEKIVEGGPGGDGNDLLGADVTDDGERLWFVGTSGAIGEYDVRTGDVNDHSNPNDVSNNFNDVAVTCIEGKGNVYVAGDSGNIYYSFENGTSGSWNSTTPGSGSAINALDFYDLRHGHAADGNTTVFVTEDGETWDNLGIENADNDFFGVDSDGADDVTVSAGGGTVWNWDGSQWDRENTGEATLRDVDVSGTPGLTVGDGGTVFRRDETGWKREETPTEENLEGVTAFLNDPEIAVGGGGTAIEH